MASAKALNADLGAVEGGSLEAELPGVRRALDREEMAARLQETLVRQAPRTDVVDCRVVSAVLLPADSVVVRYAIVLADGDRPPQSLLVTGRVFPDVDHAAAYLAGKLAPLAAQVQSREELALLQAPVALVPALAMVLHAFPLDGELPTLAAATDPAVAGPVLADLLAAGGHVDPDVRVTGCRAEPVHYNRRHRCMLSYHLELADGQSLRLYGKVASDGSGTRVPHVVAALRPLLTQAGVAVPECLGFAPDLQLTAFTEITGAPKVARLLKARLLGEPAPEGQPLERAVESCAAIAARLHTSDLQLGDIRSLTVEVARLRADLVPIQALAPELAELLAVALDVVERGAGTTPDPALRQCHGDFSYTQLVFDGPRPGLVDFDNFCLAEPALDLGQFLAYLRYAGVKAAGGGGNQPAQLTDRLADLFLASYVRSGGPAVAVSRVDVYEAINLVRMAQHAWQNLKSRRLQSVVGLLRARLSY